jgi:broad specificity phosphatase PhoE
MALSVAVVQHGEKADAAGDPGLTARGRAQAQTVADSLVAVAVWSSPLRRARETAEVIARLCSLDLTIDARLQERMNWTLGSRDEFFDEWRKASADRSYVPRYGDSSSAAASRFLAALDDLAAAHADGTAVVVSHGGVTTDALRTLLGDDALTDLIENGIPPCAITTLERTGTTWSVTSLPPR